MEKTEDGKSNNSKRRFSIEAILILAIAAICSGGGEAVVASQCCPGA